MNWQDQEEYEQNVKTEIHNFILWFWSDDKEREKPLKALEQYDADKSYNEVK